MKESCVFVGGTIETLDLNNLGKTDGLTTVFSHLNRF